MIKMKHVLKHIVGIVTSVSLVVGLCPFSAFAISASGTADYSETPTVRATYELIDDKDNDGKISAGDTFWMIVKVHDISTIGTGQAFLQYDSTVIQPTLANGTTQQKPNNVNMFAGLAEKSSTIVATSIYEANWDTTFEDTAWYGTEVADFRAPRASDKVDLSNPNMWVIGYNFGIGAGIEAAGLTNWTLTDEQKENGIQLYKMRYTAMTDGDPLVSFLPLGTFVQLDSVAEGGAFKEQIKGTMNLYVEPILGAVSEEATTTLSAIAVADIAAPAAGGSVPTGSEVTFSVAEGGTAPAEAAASITWTKDGAAYNEAVFNDYDTAYTATYTVTIPEGYAYAGGVTAVTLGGADAGTVTDNATTITFTRTYTTAANPDAALVAAAKSTVEGESYTANQADIADAAAAKAALQAKIDALNLGGVTAAVNDGTYEAPVAGTVGTPAGTDGSYQAAVALSKGAASDTTAEVTLTIQATEYVAPGVTAAPTFSSDTYTLTGSSDTAATFPVSNSGAYGGAVTVEVYTDAQASAPAAGVTGSYSNGTLTLNGVSAGEYFVTFTEADKTVSGAAKVTVKAYVEPVQPVEPPKPAAPGAESGMTKEDPDVVTGQASYEFTYKSTETGTPVMGKVTLKKKAGGVFELNTAADASTVYQMTAAPESGYKFVGWVKAVSGRSLLALDANGIDTRAVTIEGTADVLSQYTAVFAEQSSVTAGDPKLDQMTVSATGGKSLLLRTDHSKDGFQSDVTDYKLYLLPGDAGFDLNMTVETKEEEAFDSVVKVSGAAVSTANVSTSAGIVTRTYTKSVSVTEGAVTVEVTSGGKTTAYTIEVSAVSAAPLILMEPEDKGSGVYGLNVSLQNTIANEFAFKLKLDSSVFAGFTKNAAELSDGDVTATLAAMTASGGAFEVVSAHYTAATNELYVVMATEDNSYSDCTAKTAVIRLEFLTSSGGSVAADEWSKLTIDGDYSKSTLTDQRFLAFEETTTDVDAGLIQIRMPDLMTIVGYLNSLMKADVQASQAAINIKSGNDLMKKAVLADTRRFTAQVSDGTYDLEIVLPNYVTLKTTVGPDNAVIGALALTAGDLTGDGQVTVEDRAALISLLYTAVSAGERGDIDGDGKVTGADLGYLLANIK